MIDDSWTELTSVFDRHPPRSKESVIIRLEVSFKMLTYVQRVKFIRAYYSIGLKKAKNIVDTWSLNK